MRTMDNIASSLQDITVGLPLVTEAETKDSTSSVKAPDGGYGWVVVFAAFFNFTLFGYSLMTFSLLYSPITEAQETTYATVGWMGSISQAIQHLPAFIYGALIVRFGTQETSALGGLLMSLGATLSSFAPNVYLLYLTYGIIHGCGGGMVIISNIVIVQQYFEKNRAIAAAIAMCGISMGPLCGSFLMRYLMDQYSWRGALFISGAIYLNQIPFTMLQIPLTKKTVKNTPKLELQNYSNIEFNKEKKSVANKKSFFQEMFDFSLLKEKEYLIFCIASMLMNFGLSCFYVHGPSRALHFGLSPKQAALVPTMIAVPLIVSRPIFGLIANTSCVPRKLQYAVGITVGAFVEMTVVFSTIFPMIAMHCALFGIANASFLSVQSTVLVDMLGIARIAKSQALFGIFIGISSLISTPLAGFIYDVTGNYNFPFLLTGLLQLLGGLMLIIYNIHERTVK